MVSQPDSGDNQPDFVEQFVQNAAATSVRIAALKELNERPLIQDLGSPIINIRWSHEGITRHWWIYFENGAVAYIPNTKLLRSPAEMETLLSDVLGRSIIFQTGKLSREWKRCECDLIMQAAELHPDPGVGITHQLEELISNTYLICSETESGEITGRQAAAIFVEQAASQHLERRYIGVQATNGLFLHLPALNKLWHAVHGPPPSRDNLCASLYQLDFHPTKPWPTSHSGSKTGAGGYAASVRMWLRECVEQERFLND